MTNEPEPEVPVIFRKWKSGDIIALFPTIPVDIRGHYVQSYVHVGQHGAADYDGVVSRTEPAVPFDYGALKRELEVIGYRLKVVRRRTPAMREEFMSNLILLSKGE